MTTTHAHDEHADDGRRRAASARRTAWIVGLVAVAVYVAFMLSAVF